MLHRMVGNGVYCMAWRDALSTLLLVWSARTRTIYFKGIVHSHVCGAGRVTGEQWIIAWSMISTVIWKKRAPDVRQLWIICRCYRSSNSNHLCFAGSDSLWPHRIHAFASPFAFQRALISRHIVSACVCVCVLALGAERTLYPSLSLPPLVGTCVLFVIEFWECLLLHALYSRVCCLSAPYIEPTIRHVCEEQTAHNFIGPFHVRTSVQVSSFRRTDVCSCNSRSRDVFFALKEHRHRINRPFVSHCVFDVLNIARNRHFIAVGDRHGNQLCGPSLILVWYVISWWS